MWSSRSFDLVCLFMLKRVSIWYYHHRASVLKIVVVSCVLSGCGVRGVRVRVPRAVQGPRALPLPRAARPDQAPPGDRSHTRHWHSLRGVSALQCQQTWNRSTYIFVIFCTSAVYSILIRLLGIPNDLFRIRLREFRIRILPMLFKHIWK